MYIESEDRLDQPADKIYPLVRDDLPKLLPYLPDVDTIEQISHERGHKLLFPETRYLFYITNKTDVDAAAVVEMSNKRCNQERTIGELKSGVNALRMPLGNLQSNWAYTVIATLAWNLSRWIGLVLPESGRWRHRRLRDKQAVTKMRFRTFVQAMMTLPAQVLRSGRQLVVRLLDWNPWRYVFFRALGSIRQVT